MNAERILIASECIGDGHFFIDRASAYARDRNVFGRPIGQNQGVQFPIARAYIQVSAASEMVDKAARMFDEGFNRSEERRGGEEGGSTCRSRWSTYHTKKKKTQ